MEGPQRVPHPNGGTMEVCYCRACLRGHQEDCQYRHKEVKPPDANLPPQSPAEAASGNQID